MRLNLSPAPERYTLIPGAEEGEPGVVITAAPALSETFEAVKSSPEFIEFSIEIAGLLQERDEDAPEGQPGPEEFAEMASAVARAKGRSGVIFAKQLARLVIESWEGVEDPDGSPAPVTPDRIEAFLDHPAIYDAFSKVYVARWMTVQLEKNGSAPSPTGTSEGETATAARARKPARNARAKSTPRKR